MKTFVMFVILLIIAAIAWHMVLVQFDHFAEFEEVKSTRAIEAQPQTILDDMDTAEDAVETIETQNQVSNGL